MRRIILGFMVATLAGGGAVGAVDAPRHLDAAIRAQERRAAARPADARALNDLGNLLILDGQSERAEEAYRRALEISPDDPMLHYNLGLLLRQVGQHRAAIRELKQAVDLDSGDAWGHFQLAMLLEEKGRNTRAVDHFVQAFLIEPQLAELEVNPQLLNSRLVARALTVAYSERIANLENAPRQYRQPNRITRLLVPETKRRARAQEAGGGEVETEAGVDEAAPDPRKRRKGKRKPQPESSGGA